MNLSKSLGIRVFVFTLCVAGCSLAQKRAITAKDFDSWKSISGQALSHDGHYLAYGLFPQEGDGVVIVRDLKSGQEWRENAGELPPPPVPDPTSEAPPMPRAIRLVFSEDSKTLVFLAYAKHDAVEKAKKDKKSPAHEELVVWDLVGGKPARVADVKNFQVPEKGDGVVAYQKYGPVAPAPATPAAEAGEEDDDQARGGGRGAAAGGGSNAEFGSGLVLRRLADSNEREFADVLEYQLAKDGKTLAYAVVAARGDSDGVFTVATTGGEPHALVTGKGRYQHLAWDDKLNELAFIGNPGGAPEEKKAPYKLYLWKTGEAKAAEVVAVSSAGWRQGFVINDHAALTFSKDGSRLFFGAAPPPPPPHATAIDEDKAAFDLWNYKDDAIPPAQKVRAGADLNRSYRAVYLVGSKRVIQLADATMPEITVNEERSLRAGSI